MEKWFNVGKIVNTHGIQGEVRVISRTDFPKNVIKKAIHYIYLCQIQDEPIELTVKSHIDP